ncbi:MAG: cytochrome c biogenesis protein CcsA [Candidatus Eisenbacteria bacterium]|uniref:Cytochrome c biogenesis protein CcsA n=1 Tax=Eiseniibacteriota bacterium TaxID=2212470 RepID=A0A956RP81_UNCEI|nr:cytochrome c biogenesis protein CcsA [Candidatus Eisenbacteria bacterium]
MRSFRGAPAILLAILLALLGAPGSTGIAVAQSDGAAHTHAMDAPPQNFLSPEATHILQRLLVQDYQGRTKPLDTYSLEMVMKVTKKGHYLGWRPLDMYLSWLVDGDYWTGQPLLYVHHPGTKELLSIDPSIDHVVPASLWDARGRYRMADEVETTLRTPPSERSKARTKLLSFDEEFQIFVATVRGITLRIFPVPNDPNHAWTGPEGFSSLDPQTQQEYQGLYDKLIGGLQTRNDQLITEAAAGIHAAQVAHSTEIMPSDAQLTAEITLNHLNPFVWVMLPYLLTFMVLTLAYAWSLARRHGAAYPLRHPLYLIGMVPFWIGIGIHAYGYILRWIVSGRAPLSNGYESLIFISLCTALAGVFYEIRDRHGSTAALSSLLTIILLGVAMLPTFDPAISPVVPVLASFWLIIHVSVITASYAFLGLCAFIGMTILILHLFKKPGRTEIHHAILEMNRLHWSILVMGIAFLSVGTLLGGVWANESWGRYWGWDPKETWALITILIYGAIAHFRFIEPLNTPRMLASGTFLAISTVVMTYFGVNYLLSGLHSYAAGDAAGVPPWIYVAGALMVLLVLAAAQRDRTHRWA